MWLFEQCTGKLRDPTGAIIAAGYAGGNCGKNPEGVNNPAMQAIKSVGPLPAGIYTMEEVLEQSHLGPFAIRLVPDAANVMCGRSGFFIHGDTTPSGNASEGCIIMPRAVREAMWASADHRIAVLKEAL
jgi:hypothetical protein